MSLPASSVTRRRTQGSSGPGGLRRFQESFRLRLQSFKEAAASGELPEGTIWLVRIIEAGQSLNGQTYTADALRAAVPIFEGVTVQNYAWSGDPSANAGHLPDAVRAVDSRGLIGNQIGSLEGVHFNEAAQSLDGYLKVYDAAFREHMLTAYKLGDVGEGGERDVFGFSIDASGVEDNLGNVIKITSANELTAVDTPAAGGRVRRLIAAVEVTEATHAVVRKVGEKYGVFVGGTKVGEHATQKGAQDCADARNRMAGALEAPEADVHAGAGLTEADKSTTTAPGEIREEVAGEKEKPEEAVKTNLIEKLKGVRLTEATNLEEKARFKLLMRAVEDELDTIRFGANENLPIADKVAFVQQVANDLVTALGSGGMQESFMTLKENAATLAGQLKLSADQLSTAKDEDVPKLLEAIRDSITSALDELSGTDTDTDPAESQEASSVEKKDEQGGATATADDFARMSAGLGKITEALKSGDPVRLREAAVEAVGEEPKLDEKDKEIRSLKERLKGQAIAQAMVKLTEDLADGAGPTVLKLIDRSVLQFNDDFSEVSGLKEAIKAVVKEFPGFAKAAAPAAADPAPAAAAAEGDRQTQAQTPQEIASAKIAADAATRTTQAAATPAATPAAAGAAPAAATAAATPAPAALGQDVALRESLQTGPLPQSPANMATLQRYQRQIMQGKTKAMKKHRDLRTRMGL